MKDRIERHIIRIPWSGCWVWMGAINRTGYPYMHVERKQRYAHRVVYEYYVDLIPEGMTLDHLCRVRCCVNPAHLQPVTLRENILRGSAPPAINHTKTHCTQGHPFASENTYIRPDGARTCKECNRKAALACWRRRTNRNKLG